MQSGSQQHNPRHNQQCIESTNITVRYSTTEASKSELRVAEVQAWSIESIITITIIPKIQSRHSNNCIQIDDIPVLNRGLPKPPYLLGGNAVFETADETARALIKELLGDVYASCGF
jgi:hypothetical protein